MESIVISSAKFQAMLFFAFSSQLEVFGNHVEATLDGDRFMWRVYGKNGSAISPYWEIPRHPQGARFKDDDAYLLDSLNDQHIRQFLVREFIRFKDKFIYDNPLMAS